MKPMHMYVIVLAIAFLAGLSTFPIAYWRVSKSEKYDKDLPLNSLAPDDYYHRQKYPKE